MSNTTFNQLPGKLDFNIVNGDFVAIQLQFFYNTEPLTPIDLTHVVFTAGVYLNDTTIVNPTVSAIDLVNGKIEIDMPEAQTDLFTLGIYDCFLKGVENSRTRTWTAGKCNVMVRTT
jgi:hypothetical protein